MLSFGELLRYHRRASGLSQEHLAGLARVSVESVGALERGTRRAPYRETVTLLAQALNLDAGERARLEAAAEAARTRTPRNLAVDQPEASTRLPIQLTSLIGREQDLVHIVELLARSRFVTITGSGGVGKTRVAVEVAARIAADQRTEVRFVDLSQLSDGGLAGETLATALDLTGDATASQDGLVRALHTRRVVIVLDNCEHIVADVALLVSSILKSCLGITFFATSRERLAVNGEVVYRLPSLDLPAEMPSTLETAKRHAGIELFLERAAAVDQAVAFNDDDVGAVVEICRRLDGIPLALELAAARVASLGLETLRIRIREDLAIVGGLRNLPARQQTIQATIAWSYDLLTADERSVLQRVSLFAGGFTLAAAESVCAWGEIAAEDVAAIVATLVDKSLVTVGRSGTQQRFALLESVRSFASERLQEANEATIVADRHAEWVAAFADWVDTSRVAFPDHRLRAEVDPELENARAAAAWALGKHSEAGAVIAGRIVGGLRTIWLTSGRRAECHRLATAVLEIIDERRHPRVVAPLLRALVQMADGVELFALADRATSVFEEIGDLLGIAMLQSHLSTRLRSRGFIDEAAAAIEKGGALFATGDLPRLMPYVVFLHNRLILRIDQKRYAEARADLEEGLAILKSLGDDDALSWQRLRAEIAFASGERDAAIRVLEDGIERGLERPALYARDLLDLHTSLATFHFLSGHDDAASYAGREAIRRAILAGGHHDPISAIHTAALLAAVRAKWHRAARLLGWLDDILTRPPSNADFKSFIDNVATLACRAKLDEVIRSTLAPHEAERCKAEGRAMSMDAALAEAYQV